MPASAPISAVADYVAMVALAQIDPQADTARFSTILNDFPAQGAPTRALQASLTDWDEAYLHGLYEAHADYRNGNMQRNAVSGEMAREAERSRRTRALTLSWLEP